MKVRAQIMSVRTHLTSDRCGGPVEHHWEIVWRVSVDAERTTLEYQQQVTIGVGDKEHDIKISWPEDAIPTGASIVGAFDTYQRWLKRIMAASKVLRDFYAAAPEGMILLPQRPLSVTIPEVSATIPEEGEE